MILTQSISNHRLLCSQLKSQPNTEANFAVRTQAAAPARHDSAETVRIPAKTGSTRAARARTAALQSGAR